MNMRLPGFITLSLLIILLLSGAAYAEDGDAVLEEESSPASDILGDIITDEGVISVVLRLSEDGAESPFFGRYFDPYEGDSFYIDEISFRSWADNNTLMRFNLGRSWNPSWSGSADWRQINEFYAFARVRDYHHFDMPQAFPAVRRDYEYGMEAMNEDYGDLRLGYSYRDRSYADNGVDINADWGTSDILAAWDFPIGTWNGSIEYNYRELEDYRFDLNDVKHSTGTVRMSHSDSNSSWYEGMMSYTVSDVRRGDNLTSWRLGGAARFNDALDVDGLSITSRIGWTNRDQGPSRIHPAGDEFDFDIGGRWNLTPEFRLHGSWEYNRADVSRVDAPTLFSFRTDPWPVAYSDNVFTQEVTTDKWTFGGRWIISRTFDLSAEMSQTSRDDLPLTDVHYVEAAPFQWDDESKNTFTLRYNPGPGSIDSGGNWLLKYETRNRSNDNRQSDSDEEHFTINWNGMVGDELWLYVGGGFLNTDWSHPDFVPVSQEGTEYGGGWNWYWDDGFRFFGDYWNYQVDGTWGYDQTTFNTGLGFEMSDEWELTVEYEQMQGDFDFSPGLDYDTDEFFLTASFKW